MTIRLATTDDWPDIHRLSRQLGYSELAESDSRSNFAYILSNDSHQLWVYQDQQIMGCLHLLVAHRMASTSFSEIVGLVVDEQARRRNIGRELVDAAKQWSQSSRLKLKVRCYREREPTLLFYRACGFAESKQQQVFESD